MDVCRIRARARRRRFETGLAILALAGLGLVLALEHGCSRKRSHSTNRTAPSVISIAPDQGDMVGNTLVLVETAGFTDDFRVDTPSVLFGSVPAVFVSAPAAESVQVRTPTAGAPTFVDVTVRSSSGAEEWTLVNGFEYTLGPPGGCLISDVNPNSGPLAGNTMVTIRGSGFPASPQVSFGLVPALAVIPDSQFQIRVTTPPGSLAGSVDVAVFDPGAGVSCTAWSGYTYETPPPPPDCTIATICPKEGTLSGGDVVTVTGSDFEDTPQVMFGPLPAPQVTFVSTTEITAEAPPGAGSGTVDITVNNPSGGTCSVSTAYTYRASEPGADGLEPNDALTSCLAIGLSFSQSLTIHGSADEDYFCFPLSSGLIGTITMTPDPMAGNLDLELYEEATGALLDGSYQPSGVESLSTPVGPGQFGVRIFGDCGAVGAYLLNITN